MNIRKKIALFLGSLHGGGAEKVMVNLAEGFVSRGYDVDLLLIKAEGPYLSLVPDQVRIVDLGVTRMRYCLPSLVRYLRREKPDTMISSMGGANLFAIIANIITKLPNRLVIRVEITASLALQHNKSLGKSVECKAISLLYNAANAVVAVSEGVKLDLTTHFKLKKDKVTTIYNPIVNDLLFLRMQESVDLTCCSDQIAPLIISVGRLELQKDYPTLIRAFAELRKQRLARLLILGEGKERGSLERLIHDLNLEEDVVLAGFVNNPFAYMNKASLFVLSSKYEGFGNVLVEAMACGTPVVSTDCPSGPAEILENGRWGKLVPVGDSSALAKAMAESLDETDRPDVRKRAMDFSVEKSVDEHLRLLF